MTALLLLPAQRQETRDAAGNASSRLILSGGCSPAPKVPSLCQDRTVCWEMAALWPGEPSAGKQTQGCPGLRQSRATWKGGQSSCSYSWAFAYTASPAQQMSFPALWFTSSRKPSVTFHWVSALFSIRIPASQCRGCAFGTGAVSAPPHGPRT